MNKDNAGKTQLNLLPPYALESVAKVRMFGNSKYNSAWGWLRDVGAEEFIDAAKRHLLAIAKDTHVDPESGMLHLAHATTSLMMALEIIERRNAGFISQEEFNRGFITPIEEE